MSTRANIIIKDKSRDEIIFYKHSDGYPEGVMPILDKFLELVKTGKIRDNVIQASGWLILLGAIESQTLPSESFPCFNHEYSEKRDNAIGKAIDNLQPTDWKCGSYEITTALHGDIDYKYIINLDTKTIETTTIGGLKQ